MMALSSGMRLYSMEVSPSTDMLADGVVLTPLYSISLFILKSIYEVGEAGVEPARIVIHPVFTGYIFHVCYSPSRRGRFPAIKKTFLCHPRGLESNYCLISNFICIVTLCHTLTGLKMPIVLYCKFICTICHIRFKF